MIADAEIGESLDTVTAAKLSINATLAATLAR